MFGHPTKFLTGKAKAHALEIAHQTAEIHLTKRALLTAPRREVSKDRAPPANTGRGRVVPSSRFTGTSHPMDHNLVVTTLEIPGTRIAKTLGIVRGIIVRSRSVVGTIGAALQSIVGGDISIYTELCEQTRSDAYDLMIRHAEEVGANAIVAVRYDATEIAQGITEVLCYGTAVQVVPGSRES